MFLKLVQPSLLMGLVVSVGLEWVHVRNEGMSHLFSSCHRATNDFYQHEKKSACFDMYPWSKVLMLRVVIPPLMGMLIMGIYTPTIGLMTIPYSYTEIMGL